MKKIKEQAKELRLLKPKIFVIGNANAGKSSFINKLIQTSNKFLSEEKKKKKLYKKNYQITDPRLINLENKNDGNLRNNEVNSEDEEKFSSIKKNFENLSDQEDESKLTTSPLPGTTIGITKVNSMTMGVKVK